MLVALIKVVVFFACFLLFYVGVFSFEKSERQLDGVLWVNLTLVIVLCWDALIAGVINIANIPVNMISISVINIASFFALKFFAAKKTRGGKQNYLWDKFNIIFFVVLIVLMLLFLFKFKGTSLEMIFYNSDAGVHFKNAMSVVRSGHLPTMYFSELWNALAIELVMPFMKEVYLYKVFIVVDWAFFVLEIEMFMLVIREYATNNIAKILTVPMTLLYALGYPAMCYLFSFFYWGIGIWLLGALALFAKFYYENKINRKTMAFFMMLCCNSITMCYMLFGPVAFVVLFIYLTYVHILENKKITKSWFALNVSVFVLPTVLAIYYCYFEFLLKEDMSVGSIIASGGGIYDEWWVDFIWIMPFVLYIFICSAREKKMDIHIMFEILLIAMIIVMTKMVLSGKFGHYYFYKFYYPAWFFSFVLAFRAIVRLLSTDKKILISYGTVFLLVAILNFGGYEDKLVNSGTSIQTMNHSANFFMIYNYNKLLYSGSHVQYPDEYMEVCDYVIEELDSEENVPLIADINNYSNCYWYEGITGEDSSDYYGWWHDFSEVQEKIRSHAIEYFVVYTDSPIYAEHQAYFDSFETCFENGLAKVCVVK